MFSSPEDAAVSAVLSMLLEVSANPKAGNVDRDHDFHDLRYEHFLASSSAAFPVFVRIAGHEIGIGQGVLELVRKTSEFHSAENVHFGAFLLLSPLVYSMGDVRSAVRAIKGTTSEDSLYVRKAFELSKARVMEADTADLRDSDVEKKIVEMGVNLFEWMKLAPSENFIAREYVDGFPLTERGKDLIFEVYDRTEDVNATLVVCYISFLSTLRDPLIIAKKGREVAEAVREMAEESLELYRLTENFAVFGELDVRVRALGVNPGSVADLVIASAYLALSEGWRF
ncbi:triphosphoribosyl-dephospho-CoA synthase [Geoglobus sp.]